MNAIVSVKADSDPFFFIEFFCGQAEIAKAFGNCGFPCRAFDIMKHKTHDLKMPAGIVLGLISVLSLPIGSAVHLGTVCTSFCWVNSGTHQRCSSFPLGCMDYTYVLDGNVFAAVSVRWLERFKWNYEIGEQLVQ